MYSVYDDVYQPKNREKKRSNKLTKKVSKYYDKDGHIKQEMQECIEFVNELRKDTKIFQRCFLKLNEEDVSFKRMDKNEIFFKISHKLKHSFNKNHYNIQKTYKEKGFSVYSNKDIYIFLLVLFEAIKKKKVKEFLDIPDVFYILRQIKGVGIDYYFKVI